MINNKYDLETLCNFNKRLTDFDMRLTNIEHKIIEKINFDDIQKSKKISIFEFARDNRLKLIINFEDYPSKFIIYFENIYKVVNHPMHHHEILDPYGEGNTFKEAINNYAKEIENDVLHYIEYNSKGKIDKQQEIKTPFFIESDNTMPQHDNRHW